MLLSLTRKEGKKDAGKKEIKDQNKNNTLLHMLGIQKFLTNIYKYVFIIIIISKLGNAWEIFA